MIQWVFCCQFHTTSSGWSSICLKQRKLASLFFQNKSHLLIQNVQFVLHKGFDLSIATHFTQPVKVAASSAGVIFRGLLHQNKFLSQSAHFPTRVWDFSASGDLLWVSWSWSSRRSGGIHFPQSHVEWRGYGVE